MSASGWRLREGVLILSYVVLVYVSVARVSSSIGAPGPRAAHRPPPGTAAAACREGRDGHIYIVLWRRRLVWLCARQACGEQCGARSLSGDIYCIAIVLFPC